MLGIQKENKAAIPVVKHTKQSQIIRLREGVTEEDKGGRMWWVYFQYMYEYGKLKVLKVVLRRRRGKRENGYTVGI